MNDITPDSIAFLTALQVSSPPRVNFAALPQEESSASVLITWMYSTNGGIGGKSPTATLMNIHKLDFHQMLFWAVTAHCFRVWQRMMFAWCTCLHSRPQADITLFLGSMTLIRHSSVTRNPQGLKLFAVTRNCTGAGVT